LYAASQADSGAYLTMRGRLMADIYIIKENLSKVKPPIQKIFCPQLAMNFARMISLQYNKIVNCLSPTFLVEGTHDTLCIDMFRSVLTRVICEYDTSVTSDYFAQNLVIQTLDSVPLLRTLILPLRSGINRSEELARVIHHLTELEEFTYVTHCNDRLVRQLGLNCSKLKKVSFLYSRGVTNACVQYLLRLTKLEFLNVDGTQIDKQQYALLLSKLPNIANIRFSREEDSLLDHIAVRNLNKITQVYGSPGDMVILMQKCRYITILDLYTIPRNLLFVIFLTKLRNLEITNADYGASKLNAVVMGVGSRLTELTLSLISNVDLQDILRMCVSLRSLVLLLCSFLPTIADTQIDTQLSHFRSLVSLKIEMESRDETHHDYIGYYINLEKINLNSVNIFTEEFVREILRRGTLSNLKEFYISETRDGAFTFEAAKLLIDHCSHLRKLGYLVQCPRFTSELIHRLENENLQQNFDLEIM
jgi:hypothetical protein